jgi:hypothetical protein
LFSQARDALERISPGVHTSIDVLSSPLAKRRVSILDPAAHVWHRRLEDNRAMGPLAEPARVDLEHIRRAEELTQLPDVWRQWFAQRRADAKGVERARIVRGSHQPELAVRVEQGAPLDTSHVLEVARGIARRPDVLSSGHGLLWCGCDERTHSSWFGSKLQSHKPASGLRSKEGGGDIPEMPEFRGLTLSMKKLGTFLDPTSLTTR